MANKPEEFPTFSPISADAMAQMLKKIEGYLGRNLSTMLGFDTSHIEISMDIIYEIIARVEKRRVYFHIFYDGCKMGELNEGALLCFWILKLCPFYCPGIETNILNAKIALCLFTNAIHYCARKQKKTAQIQPTTINNLYYAFRFRDISKESMMILAESFIK
jgi:hypothetical protein